MVGTTSTVWTKAQSTRPSDCPGRFTKSGTGATSAMLPGLIERRSETPTSKPMP